mmetsp:Transcript_26781/g.62658  ORF Transcript_26781/g.62658 Transcript_26781/m.62658 type:complete len:255 (-) Transcript_26781:599-1363(-)
MTIEDGPIVDLAWNRRHRTQHYEEHPLEKHAKDTGNLGCLKENTSYTDAHNDVFDGICPNEPRITLPNCKMPMDVQDQRSTKAIGILLLEALTAYQALFSACRGRILRVLGSAAALLFVRKLFGGRADRPIMLQGTIKLGLNSFAPLTRFKLFIKILGSRTCTAPLVVIGHILRCRHSLQKVSVVHSIWSLKAKRTKIRDCLEDWSGIYNHALTEEDYFVEQCKRFWARLKQTYYAEIFEGLGKALKRIHNLIR